jgi:hypothetical protein
MALASMVKSGILGIPSLLLLDGEMVSVRRAPQLRRFRAFEGRIVRLHARRLASTAPCERLREMVDFWLPLQQGAEKYHECSSDKAKFGEKAQFMWNKQAF